MYQALVPSLMLFQGVIHQAPTNYIPFQELHHMRE
jgi:hypothetical protein